MNITNMVMEDYNEVYQLWLSTPNMGLNDLDDSYQGIEKYLKRNPTTCFVAKDEQGSVLGVILCGHDGRRGYLYHTAVIKSKQQQGIGSQLVAAAIKALKVEGIAKVALVTFQRNEKGNQFWEGQGFLLRDDLKYRNKSLSSLQRIDT